MKHGFRYLWRILVILLVNVLIIALAGVIYQPGAFSCLYDGGVDAAVADSAYRAARDAINGNDPSGGAVYYYNPVKSTNKWIFSRPVITVIGNHRFCS